VRIRGDDPLEPAHSHSSFASRAIPCKITPDVLLWRLHAPRDGGDRDARRRGGPFWAVVFVFVFALAWSGRATAAPTEGTGPAVEAARVRLQIHRSGERRPDGERTSLRGGWVDGVVEYTLDRPAQSGDVLVLLDFAAFMREEPRGLDEVALGGYVDGPFRPGATHVHGHWGASRVERRGPRRDLVLHLEPGTRSVTLRYAVEVPNRFWPFGCAMQRCSLSGAVAPLPSMPARGGRWLPARGRVVAPVAWTVERAALASPGDVRPGSTGRPRKRRPDEVVVVGGDGTVLDYPSVFWGPKWHRTTSLHHGIQIEVLHPKPRTADQVPHERPLPLRRDVPGHVETIASELVELLGGLGIPPSVDSRITVVQGPLRSTIAEAHPEVVLLTDQALELFPVERFLKFHQEAIARALLEMLTMQTFRGSHDPSTDLWLGTMVAFALLQPWREGREHADEFAYDILRRFTFVPAVDRFLYTQQASFSSTYFRGVEDDVPLRNHPLWFAHELPSGRRIHEKLADTLSPAQLDRFYRSQLATTDADPARLAARAYGHDLGWFFDQWLGPYPNVNYLIEAVHSERLAEGWRHTIVVGKDADRPIIEPVQVLVTEKSGERHHLVWNGELGEANETLDEEPSRGTHVFVLRTHDALRSVRLDPRNRLFEHARPPRTNVDPRFDNRQPAQFRFLYTGAGLSVAASEFVNAATTAARFNAVTGFVSFEGSLRRDLRRTGHLLLLRDRETNVAVGGGANLWFGRKVNRQRRRARVRMFATTSWLNARSLDPRGGLRLSERVALIDDTRGFFWWPERGRSLGVGVTARQTIRVDEGPKDHRMDLAFDAGWVHMWRLTHGHVIATSLGTEMVVPLLRDPEFRNLMRVGGIGRLSGYAADEVFGLATASGLLEYRHVLVGNLNQNFAHLAWLRSLGGVAFTGATTVSGCESLRGWFGRSSWYGHAGYAVMAYLSILGVNPQLLKVDVSFPFVRRTTQCLQETLPDYLAEVQGIDDPGRLLPPFNVNVTFNQTF
jgi:hypothetical protein